MGLEPLVAVAFAILVAGFVAVRWRGGRQDDWTEHPPVAPPGKRSHEPGDWPHPEV